MKKTILILLAGLLAVGCASTRSVRTNPNESNQALSAADTKMPTKAVRNFWRVYGESKNEKWYTSAGLSIAEFRENGVAYKIVYGKPGNWLYTLKQYSEKELPADVRALVKSSFYDYPIGWVKEVNESQRVVYFVHLENDRAWQTVLVEDGQYRVAEQHVKDELGL